MSLQGFRRKQTTSVVIGALMMEPSLSKSYIDREQRRMILSPASVGSY